MGGKDISEKILEGYNDVFSDIVNVLLFDGKEVLLPDELEDQAPRSYYKTDGKLHEMERDVAKRWKKGNIRIACVGIENQTNPDPDMPLRVMGYDGVEYRAQLLADHTAGKNRYPVVTLVLYFGHKKHWDQPLRLKERLDIPPEFEPYVNDYKVNLFEVAYLTHEQVELFRSDFRVVADYFVQKREKNDYHPEPLALKHVHETLQLLSVMSDDQRFEAVYQDDAEGGIRNMCDVLDRIEQKGRREGRQEGELEAKRDMAVSLAKMGISIEDIAKAAKVSVDEVKQWLDLECCLVK
ncbi:MAG TPA: Rpn family recombination-promoting nuclease/putative transposase [Candidatus Limivivens intestinipullorum]|uniref:Rpn family recombination-promoting nuclease/putative transposase n=1 Tax=Candidatus Limivivens intestinipullorum TaxID=2840858 RepID=A0A9D1ET89_9FIRM|nr:Rpn family recombination-promoting nuclease/putative transposase [Candidatus Limivivens intestinipullorum]